MSEAARPQVPSEQWPCRLLTQQTPRLGTVAGVTPPVPVPCRALHCDVLSPLVL